MSDHEPSSEGRPLELRAMAVEAVSLDLSAAGHSINRMPFSGILVRLDEASDAAPHGTNGKRIILTRAAAEEALPSLISMGVDLREDLSGHDAQNKVGVITNARIEEDAIHIEGILYSNDFPKAALSVQLNKADLGFSFEAAAISVEDMSAPILTITKLHFTGAAIILRDQAAFRRTAIAAAAAKEQMMAEIEEPVAKVLVEDAVAKAMEPITAALASIAATQAAQAEVLEELRKSPEVRAIEANAAMCAAVQPHVDRIRAAADMMKENVPPIGVGEHGHVAALHRIGDHMMAEASRGRLPSSFEGSGSAWASADPSHQQQTQHRQTEDEDDMTKVTEDPQFIALQASAAKTADELKKSQDAVASLTTMIADIQAQMKLQREPPPRKTVPPEIATLLARNGLTAPEEANGTIPLAKIDAALEGLDTAARMRIKTSLGRAGIISIN